MLKDIEGYEGLYKISYTGKVKSVKSGKYLKPYQNKCGHLKVFLYKNGKAKKFYIHRLVALHFLRNPNKSNWTIVNHIDGNKKNCHVNNLEWCSQSANIKHAWSNSLIKRSKSQMINRIKKLKPDVEVSILWRMTKAKLKKVLKEIENDKNK